MQMFQKISMNIMLTELPFCDGRITRKLILRGILLRVIRQVKIRIHCSACIFYLFLSNRKIGWSLGENAKTHILLDPPGLFTSLPHSMNSAIK